MPSLSNCNNVIAKLSVIIVQKCYISCAGIIHMVLGSRILLNYMFGYCDLCKDITQYTVRISITRIQWNPSNPDTLGTIPNVLFREVS